jgi:hypothetical protein
MIFTELYTTFMEEATKVVCLEGSFESGEILKIFIIITIKGNNRIDTFLFFFTFSLHSTTPSRHRQPVNDI